MCALLHSCWKFQLEGGKLKHNLFRDLEPIPNAMPMLHPSTKFSENDASRFSVKLIDEQSCKHKLFGGGKEEPCVVNVPLRFTVKETCSPRRLLLYPSSKQWQALVSHENPSLQLWQQRLKQTGENKSCCLCLTASITALLGDLGSMAGWKNLWDIRWGCWMVFDISQCCLGSESGRLES